MATRLTESTLRRIVREEAMKLTRGPSKTPAPRGGGRRRKSLTEAHGEPGDMSAITSALQSYMSKWMRDNNVVGGAINGDPDHDAAEALDSHIMSHVQDVIGEFMEMNDFYGSSSRDEYDY
jgi:hypothetical protein